MVSELYVLHLVLGKCPTWINHGTLALIYELVLHTDLHGVIVRLLTSWLFSALRHIDMYDIE